MVAMGSEETGAPCSPSILSFVPSTALTYLWISFSGLLCQQKLTLFHFAFPFFKPNANPHHPEGSFCGTAPH